MKVLVYGHSYVRELEQKCDWPQSLTVNDQELDVLFTFRYFPGKNYQFLVERPQEFEILEELNPDYMIIILGGNSIVDTWSNGEVKALANEFYEKLNESLPDTVKIAVQIEPRYYEEDNPFGAPTADDFNRRRQIINNFVNKQLKRRGLVDHMALLGPASMYGPDSFRDGVHLNDEALQEYQGNLINTLVCAMEN